MAMDHEHLVRRAIEGDKTAFVNLTRRFQHFAFGSALAEVGDFQRAEDIVQESFVCQECFSRPHAIQNGFKPSRVMSCLCKPTSLRIWSGWPSRPGSSLRCRARLNHTTGRDTVASNRNASQASGPTLP